MTDEQDQAEAIDEDEIDTEFPPDQPLGVDDPQEPDSLALRTLREEQAPTRDQGPVVQPYVDDPVVDEEPQAVADASIDGRDPEADGQPAPAEEAAIHLEP